MYRPPQLMFGTYAIHFPLTDFAVSLLIVGAFVDVVSRVFDRAGWQTTVDWLLFTGLAGVLVTVASGFWLVSVQFHPNDDTLALHHAFAYATLAAVTIAVIARALQRRVPRLSWLRTIALVVAAFLVACAAFVGGSMSHGGHRHSHGAEPEPPVEPAPPTVP